MISGFENVTKNAVSPLCKRVPFGISTLVNFLCGIRNKAVDSEKKENDTSRNL